MRGKCSSGDSRISQVFPGPPRLAVAPRRGVRPSVSSAFRERVDVTGEAVLSALRLRVAGVVAVAWTAGPGGVGVVAAPAQPAPSGLRTWVGSSGAIPPGRRWSWPGRTGGAGRRSRRSRGPGAGVRASRRDDACRVPGVLVVEPDHHLLEPLPYLAPQTGVGAGAGLPRARQLRVRAEGLLLAGVPLTATCSSQYASRTSSPG